MLNISAVLTQNRANTWDCQRQALKIYCGKLTFAALQPVSQDFSLSCLMAGDVSQVLKSAVSLKNPHEQTAKSQAIVEFSGGILAI